MIRVHFPFRPVKADEFVKSRPDVQAVRRAVDTLSEKLGSRFRAPLRMEPRFAQMHALPSPLAALPKAKIANGIPVRASGFPRSYLATGFLYLRQAEAHRGAINTLLDQLGQKIAAEILAVEHQPRDMVSGIWYNDEFNQFLIDTAGFVLADEAWGGFSGDCFEPIHNSDDPFVFRLKEGFSASEALDRFLAGPTVADCGSVMTAILYKVVRSEIGQEMFDTLFGSKGSSQTVRAAQRMRLDCLTWNNPLREFVRGGHHKSDPDRTSPAPFKVGDWRYIHGVEGYTHKHPVGNGCGWNVFVVGQTDGGEPLYAGFGLGTQPLTEAQISAELLNMHNAPRSASSLAVVLNDPEYCDMQKHGVVDNATKTMGLDTKWGQIWAATIYKAQHRSPAQMQRDMERRFSWLLEEEQEAQP